MAKQLINVGSQANDGTGDSIRTGAQKINSVINEIYNDLGDGTNLGISISNVSDGNVLRANGTDFVSAKLNYSDLANTPTIPAAQVQVDWNSESGVTAILNKPLLFSGSFNDLDDVPSFSDVALSGSYADLLNVPVFSDVAISGDYGDLSNLPTLFSGSYEDLTDTPNLATVATSGDYTDLNNTPNLATVSTSGSYEDLIDTPNLATVSTSGSYEDLTDTPQNLLASRGNVSVTTGSIDNDEYENLSIIAHKSYLLLKIATNIASRIVVYTDASSRSQDSSRDQNTPFDSNTGVIADIITSGNETITLTPGVIGFNNDTVPSEYMYLKIINKSGQANSVDVTFTLVKLED